MENELISVTAHWGYAVQYSLFMDLFCWNCCYRYPSKLYDLGSGSGLQHFFLPLAQFESEMLPTQRRLNQRNHMTLFLNNCISWVGWPLFKKAFKHMANVITPTIWALFPWRASTWCPHFLSGPVLYFRFCGVVEDNNNTATSASVIRTCLRRSYMDSLWLSLDGPHIHF